MVSIINDDIESWEYIPNHLPDLPIVYLPKGFMLLYEAINCLGKNVVGEAWSGSELTARRDGGLPTGELPLDLPPQDQDGWHLPSRSGEQVFADETAARDFWSEERPSLLSAAAEEILAFARFKRVGTIIRDLMAEGSLQSYLFRGTKAEITPIPKYTWYMSMITRFQHRDTSLDEDAELGPWYGSNTMVSIQISEGAGEAQIRGPVLVKQLDLTKVLEDLSSPAEERQQRFEKAKSLMLQEMQKSPNGPEHTKKVYLDMLRKAIPGLTESEAGRARIKAFDEDKDIGNKWKKPGPRIRSVRNQIS